MDNVQSAARRLCIGTSAFFLASLALPALADGYPARPIRLIVPLTAGSAADVLARQLGAKMTENWGQQVVTDNRPGAGGTIGTAIVARAPADGYTLLVHSAAFAVSAAFYSKLPYDAVKDFAPVSQIAIAPIVLVVAPSLNVKSVKSLLALAKQKSGQLTFASSGVGTSTHFAAEQFKVATGINAIHVPYKGPPEALLDVATARVSYFLAPLVPALPFIKDGRLLALGVTTAARSAVLPDIPTIAEAGVSNYEYQDWWGLFAPARTPHAVIDKLSKEIARVVALTEVVGYLHSQGAEAHASSPEVFSRFVRAKVENTIHVVRLAGIRPE